MQDGDNLEVFQAMSSRTNFKCGIYFTTLTPSLANMYLSTVSCLETNCDSFEHYYVVESLLIVSIGFILRFPVVEVFIYSC